MHAPWWASPAFALAGVLLAQKLPEWRGRALVWSCFGVGLALRVPWPLSLLLPSALVPALRAHFASLRPIAAALRWGRLDVVTCSLAAAIVLVSSAALVAWFRWGGADVSDIIAAAEG
jgi:hypothetical protein